MERDDANGGDDAASYVYESRNVDAVVGGGGGMRRNAPGAREQRTGGDEEEKGREGRDGTSDVGRATTTATKRRGRRERGQDWDQRMIPLLLLSPPPLVLSLLSVVRRR